MKAARKAFTETLLEVARQDSRIFAVATDSRGSVTLNDFVRSFPASSSNAASPSRTPSALRRDWPVRD